jgi:hypothetical protein
MFYYFKDKNKFLEGILEFKGLDNMFKSCGIELYGVAAILHLERDCRLGVDSELPEQGDLLELIKMPAPPPPSPSSLN